MSLPVSIPDRVLGIFRPPVPEALLYLVFNVHLRLHQQKYHFSLRPVNTLFRPLPSNPYQIKALAFASAVLSPNRHQTFTAIGLQPQKLTPRFLHLATDAILRKNIARSPLTP